jgi:hypothetical protein
MIVGKGLPTYGYGKTKQIAPIATTAPVGRHSHADYPPRGGAACSCSNNQTVDRRQRIPALRRINLLRRAMAANWPMRQDNRDAIHVPAPSRP